MQNTNKTQTAESRLVQKVFESDEFACVRTLVEQGGAPGAAPVVYFVAKDACDAMDYQNHRQAIKRHVEPEDVSTRYVLDKNGRRRKSLVINESGLFSLILASRQEKARRFRHYVTSVILPSIMHYGAYIEPEQLEQLKSDPRAVEILAANLERLFRSCDVLKERLAAAQREYQQILPDAVFGQSIQVSEDAITVGAMAKLIFKRNQKIGQNRFFDWLRKEGYLCRRACFWNQPTQKALQMGILTLLETTYRDGKGKWRIHQKPMVTPLGQQFFMTALAETEQEAGK